MQLRRKLMGHGLALCALGLMATPASMMASSHREAPITSLDQKADITDWYAFVNPQHPDRVVFIMNVDPFLEPSNGPNYFPFDPNILYEMKVDNNFDGKPDISFQFRFTTEVQLPGVFTGLVGGLAGIPQILDLTGPRSAGLSLRQHYSVNMVSANGTLDLTGGQTLYALPTNVGPRTMPQYGQLAQKAIYNLPNFVTVFAGTVADPFFVDLGAAFDSLNFRTNAGGGVLPPGIDGDDAHNYAPNAVAGFNVNSIVLSVPIQLLTQDGKLHVASDKLAVIGTWATTSRQQMPVLSSGITAGAGTGNWTQVQRLGNPLINELIIGTGSKDMFSVKRALQRFAIRQLLPEPAAGDDILFDRHSGAERAAYRSSAAGAVCGSDLPRLREGRCGSGGGFVAVEHRHRSGRNQAEAARIPGGRSQRLPQRAPLGR